MALYIVNVFAKVETTSYNFFLKIEIIKADAMQYFKDFSASFLNEKMEDDKDMHKKNVSDE